MSSAFDIAIEGGQAYVDGKLGPSTIALLDGRISAIHDPGATFTAHETIDATGLLVLPGFIDPHVHLRDPGPTYKEDIGSGTQAAAAGGITLVGDMPNCSPPTKGASAISNKRAVAEQKAHVDLAIWAGASSPADVEAARDNGAIGIKVFLNGAVSTEPQPETKKAWDPSATSFHPDLLIENPAQLFRIAEAASAANLPLAVHLGEQSLLNLYRGGWGGRSFVDVLVELKQESPLDKRIAASTCVEIAAETGVWLHLVHVPVAAVPIAVAARHRGVQITIESFVPFMSFSNAERLGPLGFNRYKTDEELAALWGWINDGTIDVIATDHAPHLLEEKDKGDHDMLQVPSGYPELDTSVAMMFDAVGRGVLSLSNLVRTMSEGPAGLLGVGSKKGRIAVGYDADLALVNPATEWTIGSRPYFSRAQWSPFEGTRIRGMVEKTISKGTLVFDQGEIVGSPGVGNVVVRTDSKVGPK